MAESFEAVARRRSGYEHDVQVAGTHHLTSDEPSERGGGDQGPSPIGLLIAALASCTATTIEMYADRKGWELGALEVQVRAGIENYVPTRFEIGLNLPAELTDEQIERLLVIAAKCPVHRSLDQGIEIETVPGALEG